MAFSNFILMAVAGTDPAADPEPAADLPTLEHGVPDAESYLPGTPPWVWVASSVGILALIALLIWLVRRFKRTSLPPLPPARDHYREAKTTLAALAKSLENQPLNEVASEASFILRRYFASTLSEPALYQTNEEFSSRQIDLPKEATDLLHDLNAAKYSKSTIDQDQSLAFLNRSQTCLETIHAARNVTT